MTVDKIILSPAKTTGKQAHKIIMRAVKRRAETHEPTTRIDFCRESGLNRAQLYRYKDGVKPGADGIFKIAYGLQMWGYEVKIDLG